ncbi:unnamed protein product [Amoebophrya sp. A120]|nr:unnamed protein product [Amoebophrya sp. A120]|eukprot:GSA120T00010558001.1
MIPASSGAKVSESLSSPSDCTANEKSRVEEVLRVEKEIDLENKIVLPGLWDSHCHAYSLAHQQKVANLRNCGGIETFQQRLQEKYDADPVAVRKRFLEGSGWDEADLGNQLPNRYELDKITTEYPIICWRRCWHIVVCNSKALEIAGISADTYLDRKDIDRFGGKNEEPTGILRENATELLSDILSKEDAFEEKVKLLSNVLHELPKAGITGIQSNDTTLLGQVSDAWQVYNAIENRFDKGGPPAPRPGVDSRRVREVEDENLSSQIASKNHGRVEAAARSTSSSLPIRVHWVSFWDTLHPTGKIKAGAEGAECSLTTTSSLSRQAKDHEVAHQSGGRLPVRPSQELPYKSPLFLWNKRTKIVLDGSLGAGTAALLAPYADDEKKKNRGLLSVTEQELEDALERCAANDMTLEAHSIGDRAFDLILTLLEKKSKAVPSKWLDRLVITHCQIVNQDLIARMKRLINFNRIITCGATTSSTSTLSCQTRSGSSVEAGCSSGETSLAGSTLESRETTTASSVFSAIADKSFSATGAPITESTAAAGNDVKIQAQPADAACSVDISEQSHLSASTSNRCTRNRTIFASIQPQFTNSDLPIIEKKLGAERTKTAYVWKQLKDKARMTIIGGSDAPVERMSSLCGMRDLMQNCLHEQESFSLTDTVAAYTRDPAFAAFRENDLGRLAVGFLADFVVLDVLDVADEERVRAQEKNLRHPRRLPDSPSELEAVFAQKLSRVPGSVRVYATYVGGMLRYERKNEDFDSGASCQEVGAEEDAKKAVDNNVLQFCLDSNAPGRGGLPIWRCPCCM